jgi:hypothetical protein
MAPRRSGSFGWSGGSGSRGESGSWGARGSREGGGSDGHHGNERSRSRRILKQKEGQHEVIIPLKGT